jgi:threonine aldolase
MRQAGILAAAGIVALETMPQRLWEDHAHARKLADGLCRIPGLELEPGSPYTNMIFARLTPEAPYHSALEVTQRLAAYDVRVGAVGQDRFRLVTHYWINESAVDQAIQAFQAVLAIPAHA